MYSSIFTAYSTSIPQLLETLFGDKFTSSKGGDLGALPSQLETLFFTNLLEVSTGKDFGALKGATPSQLEILIWGQILLRDSIGRDFGALKALR